MIKLKKLVTESSTLFTKRKFGDPLPTLSSIMEKHQGRNGVVIEAGPKMRTKPGQKELRAITNKLEILKRVDISSRHRSKFISAIKSAQTSISKIESIIRMSSTL